LKHKNTQASKPQLPKAISAIPTNRRA